MDGSHGWPTSYVQIAPGMLASMPISGAHTDSWQQHPPQQSYPSKQHQSRGQAPYHQPTPTLNYLDHTTQQIQHHRSMSTPTGTLSNQFAAMISSNRPGAPAHLQSMPPPVHMLEYSDEDDEDDETGDLAPNRTQSPDQTKVADQLAQKRRMKRFRLTHNQTRLLINEFVRQPHPDAAHRERLSQEIPGLSPRQVQVWFQNRRAKMKRLSPEDRERVLRSRTLPDDFDPYASRASISPIEPGADWIRPRTHIGTMNDLKDFFVQAVDSISQSENPQPPDHILSGIESAISQNAYPSSPPTSNRGFPVNAAALRHARMKTAEQEEQTEDGPFGLAMPPQPRRFMFGLHIPLGADSESSSAVMEQDDDDDEDDEYESHH